MEINNFSLNNYIRVFNNVWKNETIKSFLKVCETKGEFEKALIVNNKKPLNEQIRKTQTWYMKSLNSKSLTEVHWANFLGYTFTKQIQKYIDDLNIKDLKVRINDIQTLRYEKTGHYKFHIDQGSSTNRTLSCIFLINEDYEGGELRFRLPDGTNELTIPKKGNTIIIWPSCFLYPHSVKPVTNGIRYSVVAWAL